MVVSALFNLQCSLCESYVMSLSSNDLVSLKNAKNYVVNTFVVNKFELLGSYDRVVEFK